MARPTSPDDDVPDRLSRVEVGLVDWLARAPLRRAMFHAHGIGTGAGRWAFMVAEVDRGPYSCLLDREAVEAMGHLFGRDNAPMGRLLRMGFVTRAGDGETLARVGERSGFRSTLFRLGRAGLDWWRAEGRTRYDALAATVASGRAAVERQVIVGTWVDVSTELPEGFAAPATRVMFATHIATVSRETEGRLYVEGVTRIYAPPGHHRLPVSGRPPNAYAERAHVMFDPADGALARRVAEHEAGHWDEVASIHGAYAREVAEAMRRLQDRTRQKAAERVDALADLARPPVTRP